MSQSSEEVARVLNKASYVSLAIQPDFNLPRPIVSTSLIPFIPATEFERRVYFEGYSLHMTVTSSPGCGLLANNTISEEVIVKAETMLRGIPGNFQVNFQEGPGMDPPPTLLLPITPLAILGLVFPITPLRIMMDDQVFDFINSDGSGVRSQGVGQIFGGPFLGNIAEITKGQGYLSNAQGTVSLSLYQHPPILIVQRLEDPTDSFARLPSPARHLSRNDFFFCHGGTSPRLSDQD